MVVRRSVPSMGSTIVLSPSGIRLPPPTAYRAVPSVPASWASKVRSNPPSASSVPMKPIRLAATSPAG